MEKISLEQAEKEFMSWFEAKKLPEYLLNKKSDDKEVIISAIQSGNLILDEENCFTQVLKFPTNNGLSELKYAARITEGELAAATKGIKIDDLIGQMPIAYVATITKKSRGEIRALDTVDLNIGKAIVSFFSI